MDGDEVLDEELNSMLEEPEEEEKEKTLWYFRATQDRALLLTFVQSFSSNNNTDEH